MLPFELFVYATPVSTQARRKKKRRDWRDEIRGYAAGQWPADEPPTEEPIRVRIGYYFRGSSLDVDNVLKAILDGLEGVVYTNDNLIVDLIVSKRSFDEMARLAFSARFARALEMQADFVHVVVDASSNVEVLR